MAIPWAVVISVGLKHPRAPVGTSAVWRPDPGRLAEAQPSHQLSLAAVKPVKAGQTGSQFHIANGYILDGDPSTSHNTRPWHRHHGTGYFVPDPLSSIRQLDNRILKSY